MTVYISTLRGSHVLAHGGQRHNPEHSRAGCAGLAYRPESSLALLPPNLPPKLPISRLKNFPIFLKFSFRFVVAVAASPTCEGDSVPEGAFEDVSPGVPSLSTPSLAADIMADPRVDGSKRPWREGVDP
jgi:hypothetical protein